MKKRATLPMLLGLCASLGMIGMPVHHAADARQILPVVNPETQGIQMSDWLVAGPFANDATPVPRIELDQDKEPDEEVFPGLTALPQAMDFPPARTPRRASVRDAAIIDIKGALGLPILENLSGYGSLALIRLHAAEESEICLLVGHQESVEVWIDGVCLGKGEAYRYPIPAGLLVRAKLKPGENLLWLRVVHGSRQSCLSLRFEKDFAKAARCAERNTLLRIKDTHVAFDGPPLEATAKGWRRVPVSSLDLIDFSGRRMRTLPVSANGVMQWPVRSGAVPAGLYAVKTPDDDGDVSCSEHFCIGEPEKVYKELQKREAALPGEMREDLNLLAVHRRWNALSSDQTILRADLNWRRKIVYTLEEYTRLLDLLESGRKDFASTPGLHILGFRSRIDGQPQFYRLFVPSVAREKPRAGIPLVVILPTVGEAERPFVESAFVANQTGAEDQSAVADRLGVALLWVGYRGQPWANPVDLAHFDEVIGEVRWHLQIDRTKTYLWGTCSGGLLAMAEMTRHPERYAATVLTTPYYHRTTNRFAERDPFHAIPAYDEWLQMADGAARFIEGRNATPLYVECDDQNQPGHGDVDVTRAFLNEAGPHGVVPTFAFYPHGYHLFEMERHIAWMLRHARPSASDLAADWPRSPGNPPGPISRALAGPFVVVVGTQGTEAQKKACMRLAARFNDAWRISQFVRCRVMMDSQVDEQMQNEYNLVLVGNEDTNSLWAKLAPQLGARVTTREIRFGPRAWNRPASGVQMVVANPRNPGRSLVLLGGTDLTKTRFGTLDLAVDGWYDFAVWNAEDLIPKVDEAGFFK